MSERPERERAERPERERAAAAILVAAGIEAGVTAAGASGEIAAVRAPADRLTEVATHAAAIRALGFRYLALDIASDTARQPDRR